MKLTGPEIQRRVNAGSIVIDPFDPAHLNPNSYNLTLDKTLLVYETAIDVQELQRWSHTRNRDLATLRMDPQQERDRKASFFPNGVTPHPELAPWEDVLDCKKDNPTYEIEIPESGVVLIPGRLYLGSTLEYTETHGLVPCIDGRSSIGRLGISIHATAGFGDVGFRGTWCLEIAVVEPVRIYHGMQFCQISYESVLGEIQEYKSKKYQGQRGPRASQIWKEFQS